MRANQISRAVEDLQTDPRLAARFRRRGGKALAGYRLQATELSAIEKGELAGLLAAGMDARVAQRRPLSKPLFASLLSRHAPVLAASLFAGVVLAVWPSATVS